MSETGDPSDVSAQTHWRLDWGEGPFKRSAQREALIAAIVRDPHDAALRGVYADLAVEEGDPHGEFVRAWTVLDALLATRPLHPSVHGPSARYAAMDDDVRELLDVVDTLYARYGRSFFPRLFASSIGRAIPTRTKIAKGFVASLKAKRADDVSHALTLAPIIDVHAPHLGALPPSVRAIGPVTSAHLDAHGGALETVRLETLSQMERSERRGRRVMNAQSAEVPDSLFHPALAHVKRLTCDVMEVEPVLAEVVPRWTALEHLRVVGVLTARTLDALGQLPALRSLEVSSLAHPLRGFEALRSLRCGLAWDVPEEVATSVCELSLDRLECRSAGTLEHLFEPLLPRLSVLKANRRIVPTLVRSSRRMTQLRELTIGSTGIGAVLRLDGLTLVGPGAFALIGIDGRDLSLVAQSELHGVRRLRVGSSPLHPGTVEDLTNASWIGDLEYLTVEMQNVSEKIVSALLSAMPKLRGLRCTFRRPKRNLHLRALTERPRHLIEDLEIVRGDPEGAIAFLQSPAAQNVRRLALLDNDPEIERALLRAGLTALEVLRLPHHRPSARLEARFGHRLHVPNWGGPLA